MSKTIDCPKLCIVPDGVKLVEVPPTDKDFSDVLRCPNDGCGKTLLVTEVPC